MTEDNMEDYTTRGTSCFDLYSLMEMQDALVQKGKEQNKLEKEMKLFIKYSSSKLS